MSTLKVYNKLPKTNSISNMTIKTPSMTVANKNERPEISMGYVTTNVKPEFAGISASVLRVSGPNNNIITSRDYGHSRTYVNMVKLSSGFKNTNISIEVTPPTPKYSILEENNQEDIITYEYTGTINEIANTLVFEKIDISLSMRPHIYSEAEIPPEFVAEISVPAGYGLFHEAGYIKGTLNRLQTVPIPHKYGVIYIKPSIGSTQK